MYQAKLKLFILFLIAIIFTLNASAFSFNKFFDTVLHPQKHQHQQQQHSKSTVPIDKAKHVKVGIYVLHVGKYDLQSAITPIDFYAIFQCTPLCGQLNFEVMNATSADIKLVAKPQGFLIYRIHANVTKTDNLRNFPFDSHTLDIVLEEKELTRDKFVFEIDKTRTALDSELSVVGYQLLPKWYAKVSDHYYSVFNRTYSSYKFSMLIQRPWLGGILKGILTPLIIVCCSFLALLLKIEYTSQRVGIATSTLITMAVFHLTLTSSLPPLGYATYADVFMLINYLCLFAILIEVVLTTYFIGSHRHALAEAINMRCAWVIPATWMMLQFITWLAFDPFKVITGN